MECRAATVNAELVWSCHSAGSFSPARVATPHAPTPTCSLQSGCCARHPRLPDCIAAVVEQSNRALLRSHSEFGEGVAPVHYKTEPPTVVTTGLPGNALQKRWLLTFVQGHRQTIEYGLQAALLTASAAHNIVSDSDLLLHCNNVALSSATLLRYLTRYPHRTRALVHSGDNSQGYRCGHLHAIRTTRSMWAPYQHVLFLHPDVYLLPNGVRWLGAALAAATGGYKDASAAFLVTNMVWEGAGKGNPTERQYFGTDLFVFRPPLLDADAWSRVCQPPTPTAPPSHRLPEHELWRLVNVEQKLAHRVLGNRTTSTSREDAYGVWHSHEPEKVAAYLSQHHLWPTAAAARSGSPSGPKRGIKL